MEIDEDRMTPEERREIAWRKLQSAFGDAMLDAMRDTARFAAVLVTCMIFIALAITFI